jgi:hypothetical protein
MSQRGPAGCPLGLFLAIVALLAQIAGPVLHPPLRWGSANGVGDLSAILGEHALCLAPNSGGPSPTTPADKAPKTDHDFTTCCFWHGSVGFVLATAAFIERVAFARSRVAFMAPPADVPTRLAGTVRARAPPVGT